MPMPRRWPRCYYAYVMYAPDGVPYYVGAGKNNRANPKYKLFDGVCPEIEFRKTGQYTMVLILEQETKEAAFMLETQLIQKYGRKDLGTGSLYNCTDGRGSRGRTWTPEEREAVRFSKLGRKASVETRVKLSASLIGNQHLLGHRHSPETRSKISAAGLGKRPNLSSTERERRAAHARTLPSDNRLGKKCSEEHKRKVSEARRRRVMPCM